MKRDGIVPSPEDFWGPPISVYTRKQAIADGTLVDLIELADKTGYGQAGFTFPIACTRRVFEECIRCADGSPARVAGQDINGRLHDVLQMLRFAIKFGGGECDRITYQLHVTSGESERDVVRVGRAPEPKLTPTLITLVAVCGPGDDAAPVITIMFPDED